MNAIVSRIPALEPHARKLARLGAWGFAFFAAKGLAWLIVPLIAMYFA
ncbi:MAG TPA: hypothetical protein VEI74_00585 [Candidatus Methylomirabilis sp.]|nr:hypothetical protein [Candidatus Methylomirabilis sp.]